MMISKKNLLTGVFAAALATGVFSLSAHAEGDKELTVYKSEFCGCCTQWSDALKEAGFSVTVHNTEDLERVKRQAAIPENMQSCHTAMVDGYVFEGHVPLEAVTRMLEERPDIKGLSVPGMPMGSLGMGTPDQDTSYAVYALPKVMGGEPTLYQKVGN
ncbi:hypothetical protein PsAD2_02668 [Pseudovibrio axinellae]|uniref:CopG protein n=1 Tax=Pseudovibrio axinellae TaxID=989403 RepID=A0A165XZR3_9HYPH|nr:DUF411 domain-containing protein [Pseudovibrio axinellae]KZL18276.1 hypothetical protein PsAD2_02668 [Pseudovibrio axinellae]SER72830.1 Uncharacterized conserved protein [Pseudovibrio axinellae]